MYGGKQVSPDGYGAVAGSYRMAKMGRGLDVYANHNEGVGV